MTRLIDVHSHWSTQRGYALRSQEEVQLQNHTWRSKANYRDEAGMAGDLRSAGVHLSAEETKALDDASDLHPTDYPYGVLGIDQRSRALA